MGKWRPGQHLEVKDPRERATILLADCVRAKEDHKASGLCRQIEGGSPDRDCCTCHFWAGAIHALEEVLSTE